LRGFDILIVSLRTRCWILAQFHDLWALIREIKSVVALKSCRQFPRSLYGPFAGRVSFCDSGALM